MNILNYIEKKKYNIFESIQLLYDMDCYGSIDDIFEELKDIMPDTVQINTEGIEDEVTLFILNELNGCLLEPFDINRASIHCIYFVKNNERLFEWVPDNRFLIMSNTINKQIYDEYHIGYDQIYDLIMDIVQEYLKITNVNSFLF